MVRVETVRVETVAIFKTPFIRFHPTLPYAAQAEDVPDVDTAEQRFLAVYLGVSKEVDGALRGQTAAAGMVLMAHEEANIRAAIDRAFARGERQTGWHLADTLQTYLGRAGRRRERDTLAAWVQSQILENAPLDPAACASIRNHAEGCFAQGQLQEAVDSLQDLAARLVTEGLANGKDPAFEIGTTYGILSQILDQARQPERAIQACRRATECFEQVTSNEARGNLSAALGSLANALSQLGRHDEALETAEQGVVIDEALNRHRNAAADHGRCAQILTAQERFAEADARYQRALDLARQVNDLELQGTTLQHQGTLSRHRGDLDSSADLFEQAVDLFQQAGDKEGEMQTYDLLATTESQRHHFDAAEAWYGRSRELAEKLDDQYQLAVIDQNVGILLQTRAKQTKNPAKRDALLRRAVVSIEESLDIEIELNNQLGAASSHYQIGRLLRLLGDLGPAEEQLLKGLEIVEPLNLPDIWKDYGELAEVAKARDDAKAAAVWTAKRDAKREELRKLADGGDGAAALPEKAAQAFMALAQAVYGARSSGGEVPPEVAEALAQLVGQPGPLASTGMFLQAVAEGGSPTVPGDLPAPLPKILGGLLAALD